MGEEKKEEEKKEGTAAETPKKKGMLIAGIIAGIVLLQAVMAMVAINMMKPEDPDIVADMATFEDPHQYSVGFDYVIVNGVAVVAGGEMTDARSGEFVNGTGIR